VRAICSFFAIVAIVLGLGSPAWSQQATADLRGFVTDKTGAAVVDAGVTLVNTETHLERNSQTLETGAYSFSGLPAGSYIVTVEKSGFATKQVQGITLTVGETANIDVTIQLGSVAETVNVAGDPPVVDTSESYIGTTIGTQEVQDLPLQSRQFANLAVLTPGVTLTYNADPTERNRLMPSIAGTRGRLTSFTVDNADQSEDMDGGLLQTVSLEAVQEFQVITHRFTAEQGRAAYGIINVITKSGSNEWHGSAFEFFRNDALNWRTHTEELNDEPKSDYNRNQYGGSFGGPIIKDKLFFFVAPERLDQTTVNIVNTQGVAPSLDGPETLPQTLFTITAKLDYQISKNNLMTFRYSREHNSDVSEVTPISPEESWGVNVNTYHTGVINLTSTLGATTVNQLTFDVTDWQNGLLPNSTGPGLFFPNGVVLGENQSLPQTTSLRKWEVRDTFSLVKTGKGSHNIKFGVDENLTPHPGGTYATQRYPQYTFLGNSLTSPISQIFYNVGNASFVYNTFNRFGLFVQDDWQVTRKLTINAGLRWDYYGGVAFNQSYSPTYVFLQSVLPSFAGKQTQNQKTNFGPRLGFAYDPVGNGKTVIRGGYGLYFNWPIESSVFTILGRNPNPEVIGYLVNDPTGILNPDGSFYQYGQPLPPNQLVPSAFPLQNAVVDPTNVAPRYQQATIGFEREIAPNTVFAADYIWSRGDHSVFDNQINRYPGPDLPRPYAAAGFNFPIMIESTEGRSAYQSLNLSIVHRYSRNFALNAWYTLSKCKSTSVVAVDEGFTSYPVDENNPGSPANFGPCALSPTHKIMVGPTWTLPKQFQVSSIIRFTSGQRYNITSGVDSNGDGIDNDLPAGVATINSGIGANFFQADLRVSKFFTMPREFGRIEAIFEMYNVFNNINPASYQGNELGNDFGQPTAFAGDPLQGEQRLIQLGVRYSF
jgi:Carboxypeptidase regulatory-like domain/TonB dependent receptor